MIIILRGRNSKNYIKKSINAISSSHNINHNNRTPKPMTHNDINLQKLIKCARKKTDYLLSKKGGPCNKNSRLLKFSFQKKVGTRKKK